MESRLIFTHTSTSLLQSGTGVLIDDAKGMHDNHITYDDSSVESIESLPPNAYHREVDREIVKADQEGR